MARKAEKYWQKHHNKSTDWKIGRMHRTILKLESMATRKNFVLLFIASCFFAVFILPYLMYVGTVIDKHYFGWFNEPTPFVAKTTDQKRYYSDKNLPFMTIADVKAEREHYAKRLKKGHPTYYQ